MIPAKPGRIFCDVFMRVAVWITLTSNIMKYLSTGLKGRETCYILSTLVKVNPEPCQGSAAAC